MQSDAQTTGATEPRRTVWSRMARLFHRDQRRDTPVTHLSHAAPDPVEWDESLIGIEPNSGEVDPPTIC